MSYASTSSSTPKKSRYKRKSMDLFNRPSITKSVQTDYGYETATPSVHLRNSALSITAAEINEDTTPTQYNRTNCTQYMKEKFQRLWTIETANIILQSSTWNGFVIFLVFIIIFLNKGIAKLFIPKYYSWIFNLVLFGSAFVLCIDVALRCIAIPKYFQWKCDGICHKQQQQNDRLRQHQQQQQQQKKVVCCSRSCEFYKGCCKFGSFAFYLDTMSILSIIPTLTYVWEKNLVYSITLGPQGYPETGLSPQERYHAFSSDDVVQVVIMVLRLGIAYRFIRHVTKLTSRFNWYGFFCNLNPFFHNNLNKTRISIQNKTYHGVKLFEGSERDILNEAAITIQKWWNNLVTSGKVDNQRNKIQASSNMAFKQTASNNNGIEEDSKENQKSQIGATMEELTGQRVAQMMLFIFTITIFFTYFEQNHQEQYALTILHKQTTSIPEYSTLAMLAARQNVLKYMFQYHFANGTIENYPLPLTDTSKLWLSDILNITVTDALNRSTTGLISRRQYTIIGAICDVILISVILIMWFFANVAFSGPVMQLVVIPIERMIKLLRMMMTDPLGYQNSYKFVKFVEDEKQLTDNTGWTPEILKGMETSFLMSTILQISSLLKVGFGSAGVDIIRQGLQKSQTQAETSLVLNSRGALVKCIFLFCDIRQFTDTTECLLEEIFVFTNKVASVVHPICSAYGGSANKNVGDAFLMSWLIEERDSKTDLGESSSFTRRSRLRFSSFMDMYKKKNCDSNHRTDADRALLAVVKILCALYHDKFILEALSEDAQNRLLEFFADRAGPLVQLGFGLHVGNAVVGAIGSQRKIDATYLSVNVDFSEFLESSTKTYGVRMLMSHEFQNCLNPNNKRRCRKVDRVCIDFEDFEDFEEGDEDAEATAAFSVTELYTLDLDIEALWKIPKTTTEGEATSPKTSDSNHDPNEIEDDTNSVTTTPLRKVPKLEIPTGFVTYKESDWQTEDMVEMRKKYLEFPFLDYYSSGLEAFYNKNWSQARKDFLKILSRFDDGPSRYFMRKIEASNGVPPKNFLKFNCEL